MICRWIAVLLCKVSGFEAQPGGSGLPVFRNVGLLVLSFTFTFDGLRTPEYLRLGGLGRKEGGFGMASNLQGLLPSTYIMYCILSVASRKERKQRGGCEHSGGEPGHKRTNVMDHG